MRALFVRHMLQGAARVAVVAIGISTTALAAGAQQAPATTPPAVRRDTSSLPFHDDQWGLDFGISGSSTYRIGAVRFTSPTRAWILDGYVNGQIGRQQVELSSGDTLPSGYPLDAIQQGGSVSLLVGRRAYRSLGTRAMRTVSLAIGGGFGYDESLADGERTARRLNSNARLQFAVGGHYRVTPSLALGATFGLGAAYTWSDNDGPYARQRSQYFSAGLGASELTLSLFF
jgi:hypothetical protein